MTSTLLRPGCRLAIAPRFHVATNWEDRLRIGAGVEVADGGMRVRESWRPPSPDEVRVLTSAAEGALAETLHLFRIPDHLHRSWWVLLESAEGDLVKGQFPGFEGFVRQLVEFFEFKELSLPEGCRCELVVSEPAKGPPPWRAGSSPSHSGSPSSIAPEAPWPCPPDAESRLWGGLNLGDAPISIALCNLSFRHMERELHNRRNDPQTPTTIGALLHAFFRSHPDYPTVRIDLAPGEGCRLPSAGVMIAGVGQPAAPELLLLMRCC